MVGESGLLRAAAAAGVPVAPVVAASDDGGVVGTAFLVMGRVEGETIARRLLRDDEFAVARTRSRGAERGGPGRDPLGSRSARPPTCEPTIPCGSSSGCSTALGQAHPSFELALPVARPAPTARGRPGRGSPAHFRLGNLMVDADGLRAVLDLGSLAHLGDPMEDLGWLCVRAWRFGAAPPGRGDGVVRRAVRRLRGRLRARRSTPRWSGGGRSSAPCAWGVILHPSRPRRTSPGRAARSRWPPSAAASCENEYDALRLIVRRRGRRGGWRAGFGWPAPTAVSDPADDRPARRSGGAEFPRARRHGRDHGAGQLPHHAVAGQRALDRRARAGAGSGLRRRVGAGMGASSRGRTGPRSRPAIRSGEGTTTGSTRFRRAVWNDVVPQAGDRQPRLRGQAPTDRRQVAAPPGGAARAS